MFPGSGDGGDELEGNGSFISRLYSGVSWTLLVGSKYWEHTESVPRDLVRMRAGDFVEKVRRYQAECPMDWVGATHWVPVSTVRLVLSVAQI